MKIADAALQTIDTMTGGSLALIHPRTRATAAPMISSRADSSIPVTDVMRGL
jgi:hypothetical protein